MSKERYWIGFGDIHEDIAKATGISELAEAEGVLVSGDITNRGSVAKARAVLDVVREINPTIHAVIGNMDHAEIDRFLQEEGWGIHASARDLGGGVWVVGVGTSTPTPFGTPSEYPEKRIGEWLKVGLGEVGEDCRHLILMVHNPPHGTRTDKVGPGNWVGSRVVREFIEKVQPEVVLTGHIHESVAVDRIGKSTIINPGPLSKGGYALIRLTDTGLVAELKHA